jgi:hypothetical protein
MVNGRYQPAVEGTFTVTTFGSSQSIVPIFGTINVVTRYGFATVSCSYIERACTLKYQTLSEPGGPVYENIAGGVCSNQILFTIIGEVSGVELTTGVEGTGPGGAANIDNVADPYAGGQERASLSMPGPTLMCTSFNAACVGGSLFDVTETWAQKYLDTIDGNEWWTRNLHTKPNEATTVIQRQSEVDENGQ